MMITQDGISIADVDDFRVRHEEKSKRTIVAFQKTLDSLAESDSPALSTLRDRLDIQLKIEELIVKSREAEHPKWKIYSPIVASIIAIVISVVGLFLPHR